jgi:hypothetical protein
MILIRMRLFIGGDDDDVYWHRNFDDPAREFRVCAKAAGKESRFVCAKAAGKEVCAKAAGKESLCAKAAGKESRFVRLNLGDSRIRM